MKKQQFNNLLLKTAFSCMACDGEIHPNEVKLIKKLQEEQQIFGEIDINAALDKMLLSINKDGHHFLKEYFNELATAELSLVEELNLIEVAIQTIKADDKVEYSEVKFFKVIRTKLKIDNEPILEKHPDFEEYLEQDIMSASYLSKLQDDFFDTHTSAEFELIHKIDENLLK
jgi:uncharacterized tellurite resistance protein B-like protein